MRPQKSAYDLSDYDGSRSGLLLHHSRRVAAERQERRHLGRVRRTGQPDGIWSARSGDGTFESDYLVSSDFHDHLHHAGSIRNQAGWSKLPIAGSEVAAGEDSACTGAKAGRACQVNRARPVHHYEHEDKTHEGRPANAGSSAILCALRSGNFRYRRLRSGIVFHDSGCYHPL